MLYSDITPTPLRDIPEGAVGVLRLLNGSEIPCRYLYREDDWLAFKSPLSDFKLHTENIESFTIAGL